MVAATPFDGVSMKELFGHFFFTYLLTAVTVVAVMYLLALPWLN